MEKPKDINQLNQRLEAIRNTIDGVDMDLNKKESLDVLLDLKKELDELVIDTAVRQSFRQGVQFEACKAKEASFQPQAGPGLPAGAVSRPASAPAVAARTVGTVISPGPVYDESEPDVLTQQPAAVQSGSRQLADTSFEANSASPASPQNSVGEYPGSPSVSHSPASGHAEKQPVSPVPQPKLVRERPAVLSENAIGKYVIGILASLLILTGVAVLAATFWNLIPDFVKFAAVFLFGILMGSAGLLAGKKSGAHNAFHLSLTGCSIAILYCDLIAARMAWGLFSDGVMLILLILWMLAGFFLSKKLHSDITFGIIQIGNAISILLTTQLMEIGFSLWLILFFVLSTVVLTCLTANCGFHKANRLAASFIAIFSYLLIMEQLQTLISRNQFVEDYPVMLSCGLLYIGLFVLSSVLFGLIPYGLRDFSGPEGKVLLAVQAQILACGIHHIAYEAGRISVLSDMISPSAPGIVSLLVLSALLLKKDTRTFALMIISFNITMVLGGLSSLSFDTWSLLPCIFCLALLLFALRLRNFWLKLGALISYGLLSVYMLLFSFVNLITDSFGTGLQSAAIHGIMILIPLFAAAEIAKNKGLTSKRRVLALLCLDTAAYYCFLLCFNLDLWMLWATAVSAALFFGISRIPVFREDAACRSHYLAVKLVLQVFFWISLEFNASNWELAAGCLLLLCFTALLVTEALAERNHSGKRFYPLVSCVLMTVNLVDIINQTPLGTYGVLISFTCLFTAGLCIVLGFRIQNKPIRTYGLILIILSVLKMVTIDVASTDSIVRVAAFIGGGLLCFFISWGYNRLDKDVGEG